jgi:hypothetical protein
MKRALFGVWLLALSACGADPEPTLTAMLARLPAPAPAQPLSEAEELMRRSLEQEMESVRMQMPRTSPVLLLRGEGVTPGILPADGGADFGFVSGADLRALTSERCGGRIFDYRRRDGVWVAEPGIKQIYY